MMTPEPSIPPLSTHARYAAYTARARGMTFRSLDGADGYLFEISYGPRKALFAAGAGSPYAINDQRAASLAKDKHFCALALAEAGLPAARGALFFVTERWAEMRCPGREPVDARAFAARANYPLFCKPVAASNGLYAELIDSMAAFEDYLARVAREHFAILIQPVLRGVEHRIITLDGAPLCAYAKRPPRIIGDGVASVQALADALPRDPGTPPSPARARGAGGLVSPDYAPRAGEELILEGPANRAAGGGAFGLSEAVPEPLARIGLAAAAAIGLRLAATDVFDVSAAGDLSDLVILEVNSNPMIKTLEDHGRWDLIEAVWRANFDAALK